MIMITHARRASLSHSYSLANRSAASDTVVGQCNCTGDGDVTLKSTSTKIVTLVPCMHAA